MEPARALSLATIAYCIPLAASVALAFTEFNKLPEVNAHSALQRVLFFSLSFTWLGLLGTIDGAIGILAHRKWVHGCIFSQPDYAGLPLLQWNPRSYLPQVRLSMG